MANDPDSGEKHRELIRVGGPVDETSATLRVFGDDLDPDEISGILRFPPTVARRKGEIGIGKSTNREYKAPTGQWHLESPRGRGDLGCLRRRLYENDARFVVSLSRFMWEHPDNFPSELLVELVSKPKYKQWIKEGDPLLAVEISGPEQSKKRKRKVATSQRRVTHNRIR